MEEFRVTTRHMAETAPLLDRVGELFAAMDRDFAGAAARYGFSCRGCDGSCCEERFYHYTFAEFLFLARGVVALEERRRGEIFRRAGATVRQQLRQDREGRERPIPCPLNEEGLCVLYGSRPMICRLHGVPYELHSPGRPDRGGGGCRYFDEQRSGAEAPPLDRSEHYAALAAVEMELRRRFGRRKRRRQSVAEMLVEIDETKLAGEAGP